jgi:hypothetical protein
LAFFPGDRPAAPGPPARPISAISQEMMHQSIDPVSEPLRENLSV